MKIKPTTPDGLRLTIVLLVACVIILFVQNLHLLAVCKEVAQRIHRIVH